MKILIRTSDASREKNQTSQTWAKKEKKILIRASDQNEDTLTHIRRKQREKKQTTQAWVNKEKRYSYDHPIKMKILIRTSDASREKQQTTQAWANKEKRYSYEHPIKMKILIRTSDASREKTKTKKQCRE